MEKRVILTNEHGETPNVTLSIGEGDYMCFTPEDRGKLFAELSEAFASLDSDE